MLEFLDVQKHHPYTFEEAMNLRTTHFGMYPEDYYMPLAQNFNVVSAVNKATDYYKFFDINSNLANQNPPVGSTVTITGTAHSLQNLQTTPADGSSRVLLYLKFRVIPTNTLTATDVRAGKIYFDPTYICYNGINITQDRGNQLLEKYPLPTDPFYTTYLQSFRNLRIPQGVPANNFKYFNTA
jgi:hypothetical protein